jgi:L-alanine-DL-glutamate epimerase-like enolase superfamily enzyme
MKILYKNRQYLYLLMRVVYLKKTLKKCVIIFHGINIKLTKCSGITPARRMIARARELHLQVMMGSMNESTLGSSAIAHFLPQLDFVDADGPLLLTMISQPVLVTTMEVLPQITVLALEFLSIFNVT